MSGSDYERELKDILDECDRYVVIRSAGSMGEADLVVVDKEYESVHVIECKATSENVYYSSKDKEQHQVMLEKEQQNKDTCFLNYIYAIRFKDGRHVPEEDKWEIFKPSDNIMRQSEGEPLGIWFL